MYRNVVLFLNQLNKGGKEPRITLEIITAHFALLLCEALV